MLDQVSAADGNHLTLVPALSVLQFARVIKLFVTSSNIGVLSLCRTCSKSPIFINNILGQYGQNIFILPQVCSY